MRFSVLFLLSLVSLMVGVGGSAAATQSNNPLLLVVKFSLNPQQVSPGGTAVANVTIMSENSYNASGATVSFTASNQLSIAGSGSTFFVGDFYVGKTNSVISRSFTFVLGASQAANSGVYPLFYTLNYQNSTGSRLSSTGQLYVTVSGTPAQPLLVVSTVSFSRSIIAPGTSFETTLLVNNTGTETAYAGVLAVVPGTGVSLVASSGTGSLVTLAPGTGESVTYQMTSASGLPSGYVPVDIRLAYSDSNGVGRSYNSSFNIQITSAPDVRVGSFALSVAPLRPGVSSVLSLSLLNVGGDRAYDLLVTVRSAAFLTGTATNYLGSVAPGGSAPAAFYLTVANTTLIGAQQFSINISYSDAVGNRHNLSSGYSINVEPYLPPAVTVTNVLLAPPILADGSQGTATIFLKNTGPTEATNVRVRITNGTGILTSNYFGVGTMGAGDQVTQVVGLSVEPGMKPQSRTMQVSVTYTDANGKSYTSTVPYQTQIYAAYNPFSLVNILIASGIVVAAMAVLIVMRKLGLLEPSAIQS